MHGSLNIKFLNQVFELVRFASAYKRRVVSVFAVLLWIPQPVYARENNALKSQIRSTKSSKSKIINNQLIYLK